MVPFYRRSQPLLYKVLPRGSMSAFFSSGHIAQLVSITSIIMLEQDTDTIHSISQKLDLLQQRLDRMEGDHPKRKARRCSHSPLTPLGLTAHDPPVDLGADNNAGLRDDATSLSLVDCGEEQDPD